MNAIMQNIEQELRRQEFRTSWHDPFFDWIRSEQFSSESVEFGRKALYIINPPIPKIAPFDFSSVMINIGSDSRISFSLSIYFRDVLVDALEVDDIKVVYNDHDWEWHGSLRTYFSDITSQFQLAWDIEYDETIEDCLYGYFALDKVSEIISLMRAIRKTYHQFVVLKGEAIRRLINAKQYTK